MTREQSNLNYLHWGLTVINLFLGLGAVWLVMQDPWRIHADVSGIFSVTMTILVTILIGWQILSFLNNTAELKEYKKEAIRIRKDHRDNMIVLASVISSLKFPTITSRVRNLLNIIAICSLKEEAKDAMDIAVTYVIYELSIAANDRSKLKQEDYLHLWPYDEFCIFFENIDTKLASPEVLKLATNILCELESVKKKKQKTRKKTFAQQLETK
ncbi:MAG: hypothetical protein JFR41_10820 [Muribaculaceae bacterium]|nr:hypothetical protein [Muribaculaceae bacterium]